MGLTVVRFEQQHIRHCYMYMYMYMYMLLQCTGTCTLSGYMYTYR